MRPGSRWPALGLKNALSGAAAPRPSIARLPDGLQRPFWSVMMPIHNARPHYLRQALQSVLQQDPGPHEMQIEVIDNCSTVGNPEELVREIGSGRIAFRRQPENVGIVANFNECVRHAAGHWVHVLHGDDMVRPGFYEQLRAGIEAHPEAGAALSRHIYIDETGEWTGFSEIEARCPGVPQEDFIWRQLVEPRVQFVAFAVRRSVFEELGGFSPAFEHCVEWDMWKRIVVCKPIFYEPEALACYRPHSAAESSRAMRTGENVLDERRSIECSLVDVAVDHVRRVRRQARRLAGVRAARRARVLWQSGHRDAAWGQFKEAARCSVALPVTARLLYFLLRTAVR